MWYCDKRLSGCHWDAGWSEGVMDAGKSGEYIEEAELSCVGRSESKMGERPKVKYHLSIWVEHGGNVLDHCMC